MAPGRLLSVARETGMVQTHETYDD